MFTRKIALVSCLTISAASFGFTIDSQEDFNKLVKQAILQNPEMIIESVNQYQSNQAKASHEKAEKYAQSHIQEIIGDNTIPSIGPEKAPITIVEFMDYQCGYCKKAHHALNDLMKSHPKEVRLSVRQYPILGAQSYEAAKLALAAHESKKFSNVHNKLFSGTSKEQLAKMQKSYKLNTKQEKFDSALKQNFELAEKLQISATPVFIITNNKEARIIPGYVSADQLSSIVKSML